MQDWLDRDLQRNILNYLKPMYPEKVNSKKIAKALFPDYSFTFQTARGVALAEALGETPQAEDLQFSQVEQNIYYLEQSGLVNLDIRRTNAYIQLDCSINNRGIDFIEDDGGLSAILGVVTIKLHADTIKALIQQKIEAADITDSEKSALKSTVSKIGDAALAVLTEKAIEAVPIAYFFSVLKSLSNG